MHLRMAASLCTMAARPSALRLPAPNRVQRRLARRWTARRPSLIRRHRPGGHGSGCAGRGRARCFPARSGLIWLPPRRRTCPLQQPAGATTRPTAACCSMTAARPREASVRGRTSSPARRQPFRALEGCWRLLLQCGPSRLGGRRARHRRRQQRGAAAARAAPAACGHRRVLQGAALPAPPQRARASANGHRVLLQQQL